MEGFIKKTPAGIFLLKITMIDIDYGPIFRPPGKKSPITPFSYICLQRKKKDTATNFCVWDGALVVM